MILSTLNDSKRIEVLNPAFKTALDYIKSNNLLVSSQETQIKLDGDNLFINNSHVKGLKKEDQVLEIHRKYIDIHVLVSGSETIGWSPLEDCSKVKVAYKEDDDYGLYDQMAQTYVTLKPGDIFIAYPEDAHAPIISDGEIHKLIVKIRI